MSDPSDLISPSLWEWRKVCVLVFVLILHSQGYVLISFEGGKEMGRCQRGLGSLRREEDFSKGGD